MVGALWLEHCTDVDDYLSPSLPSHPDGGLRSNPESTVIQGGQVGLYCDVAGYDDIHGSPPL